jgi:eukaryotic-like serine/threonine-protein kinase
MTQIADYEIVRELGRGNHGTFYLAKTPERLGLTIPYLSLKVLGGGSSQDTFKRVVRELRAFSAVNSPYLVSLFDAGQEGDVFYYAMEYFEAGTLEQPATPLDLAAKVTAVADAARAAHALHEGGIAHRDIRPANIALADDHARLADLGLAQVMLPHGTVTGMGNIGSVEFMDPVIMRGGKASRSTEIWALGATLHRAASGRSLFGDFPLDDPLLAMRAVLAGTPAVDPSLPEPVAAAVRGCLADPGRFATAAEVAERLDQVAGQV